MGDSLIRRAASTAAARRKFGDAWVFTDRDDMAQDNAEHLIVTCDLRIPT